MFVFGVMPLHLYAGILYPGCLRGAPGTNEQSNRINSHALKTFLLRHWVHVFSLILLREQKKVGHF